MDCGNACDDELVIKSSLRLRTIKRSALPLQNPEVRRLYNKCLNEMKITRNIPVYSTAFLKSPIIVGFLKPCIYLPIHLISDLQLSILLKEVFIFLWTLYFFYERDIF